MRTISYRIGIISLIREIWYTICQMKDEAPAAQFLPTFVSLHEEAKTVLLPAELEILEQMSAAQAQVDKADSGLDTLAGRVSRAVEDIAEAKTKKQLKTNLFKGLPLSKFRRPVLGGQLVAQSGWGSTLNTSGIAALSAFASPADSLVEKGADASQARTDAAQENREFRDVGARKQFIDKVNGARLLSYGTLSKAPLEDPTLPSDYAENFYLGDTPPDEEETIDDVKAAINELNAKLAERQQQLGRMEAEAEAAVKIEAHRQAKRTELEQLQAQSAALQAKIDALKGELKK